MVGVPGTDGLLTETQLPLDRIVSENTHDRVVRERSRSRN